MSNRSTSFLSPQRLHSGLRRGLFLSLFALLLCCFITLSHPLLADVTIKFDDLKDGDKISDVAIIVVRADSNDGVDKVEFAVDDQLKFTTGSTPYTYKWDTITEIEGKHVLAVTAIDSNGVKKTVTLNLTIDNDIEAGAEALAAKSVASLKAKDVEAAVKFSRRALKADPTNIDAARSYSAVLASRYDLEKAISTLAKAKNLDKSVDALLELSSYRVKRAFRPEFAASVGKELEIVFNLRKQAATLQLEALKTRDFSANPNEGARQRGDTYFRAGRYKEAQTEFTRFTDNSNIANLTRLTLAYTMDHQEGQTFSFFKTALREKTTDQPARAVIGLALLRQRLFIDAKAMVSNDAARGYGAALIIASYADSALGKPETALREALQAQEVLPELGEVHFALSMCLPKLAESERELVQAIVLSPLMYGPYLDYAQRFVIDSHYPDRFENALTFTDFVLKNDPGNDSAKFLKTLIYLGQKPPHIPEAEILLLELTKKEPKAADFLIATSTYFTLKGNATAASDRLERGKKADSQFDALVLPPTAMEVVAYILRKRHYRAEFFLSTAALYPPKPASADTK